MSAFCVTPTGELLIFNTVKHAVRRDGYLQLLTDKEGGFWVADVPIDWLFSWIRPTFSAPRSDDYATLKRALRNFDSRTGRFKD